MLFGLVTWIAPRGNAMGCTRWCGHPRESDVFQHIFPYWPWHTAFIPVLALVAITFVTTSLGRQIKERLGTAESKRGRSPSQVTANLGVAAIASSEFFQSWLIDSHGFANTTLVPAPLFTIALAALAEAAADTASSEIGQVFGGNPRMITTLRKSNPVQTAPSLSRERWQDHRRCAGGGRWNMGAERRPNNVLDQLCRRRFRPALR